MFPTIEGASRRSRYISTSSRSSSTAALVSKPSTEIITDRVAANVDEARAAVRAVLDGQTTAEAHRRTAWGLYEAGVEYLDHMRAHRNVETLFGRAILDQGRAKAKVLKLARDAALVG